MSWLGPALSGAHPRTKGARCFTGGHRHRLPLTPKGLLVPRRVTRRQSTRGPIGADGTINDQGKAHGSVSSKSTLLASEPTSAWRRSEEHTSELQSLMRISYAVFCLKKKNR